MGFHQFKTNINCNNCKATVTPFLEGDENIVHWEVDLEEDDRILTVETEGSPKEVIETVEKAGFKAEQIG